MRETKPPPKMLVIEHSQVTHMTHLLDIITDTAQPEPQGKKTEQGWVINSGVRFNRDGSNSTDDFNNMIQNAEAAGYQFVFVNIKN